MNTFTLGACFQHELHTRPYFMTFAPRLIGEFDNFLTASTFLVRMQQRKQKFVMTKFVL